MPTLHPHPEDLDFDDLEPMTLCDRCGLETPVSDTSAGLPAWQDWSDATLCPDCWTEVQDAETNGFLSNWRAAGERLATGQAIEDPSL